MVESDKTPEISVIICCYGGEKTIKATLESLLHQDLKNDSFEVIIVDDGSKDNSSKIIKDFIKFRLNEESPKFNYFRKKNEGLSIARNFGLNKSLSNIVVYIDEDATVYENYLSVIIDYFKLNLEVNCVGGEVELYNDNVEFARLIQDSIFSLYMKDENSIIGTNMAFRKSFLENVGGFQPEFTYRGDETALFIKSKDKLVKGRLPQMKVKHFQPPNTESWLKTRFENGYFSMAIDFFIDKPKNEIYIKFVKSLMFVSLPYIVLIAFTTLYFLPMISIILFIVCLGFLYRKFLSNKLIQNTLEEFRLNRKKNVRNRDRIRIIILIIKGVYKSDIGYIKGYSKFKNVIWIKHKS